MSLDLKTPGVYIQEIQSDVRPIVGISTSDTAFVDFFARGNVNEPVRVASFAEFARQFGGFDPRSEASYAIAQYFANGGSVAWVVRVAQGTTAASSKIFKNGGNDVLEVSAISQGVWGDDIKVTIAASPVTPANFDLTAVLYGPGAAPAALRTEVFPNLSMDPTSPRYAIGVITGSSELITVERKAAAGANSSPSPANGVALTGGQDGSVPTASASITAGIDALDAIAPAHASLLCLPGAANMAAPAALKAVFDYATAYCEKRRMFLLIDVPSSLNSAKDMSDWRNAAAKMPSTSPNSAIYFPRVNVPDPLLPGQLRNTAASGTIAGITARTDAARGVWKAPAGTDASIRGATPVLELNDDTNGELNILGVNVLRSFPIYGSIVWGARTTKGADAEANPWKYLPVRRMALYLEESLYQGLKWVTFEPNDYPLWAQIRLNVGSFLNGLFRQGAFAGVTTREAYFVKCDKDTTTPGDVDRGVVNVLIGFAPLKPAEFVVLQIQQMAGQAAG